MTNDELAEKIANGICNHSWIPFQKLKRIIREYLDEATVGIKAPPPAAIELPCCSTCRFYLVPKDCKKGICRRYPPTVNLDGPDVFPVIGHDDWCGEWRGRE